MDALGWTCRHEYWPRLEPCLGDDWQTCAELARASGLSPIRVNYAMAAALAAGRVQSRHRAARGHRLQALYRRKET